MVEKWGVSGGGEIGPEHANDMQTACKLTSHSGKGRPVKSSWGALLPRVDGSQQWGSPGETRLPCGGTHR